MLEPLFECVFDEVYTYVKQSLSPKMDVLECNVITQVCVQFSVIGSERLVRCS